ncbi:MAG: N-formylglutamate amidohydrolase [Candidatus Competibacteraceae bacterium]
MNATIASLLSLSSELSPTDPPAVEIVNPDGRTPLLLVCDHASKAVPRRLNNLGLRPEEVSQHIGWDPGAAEVTRRLAKRLDAPAVLSGYSRLVIDCNRSPGDPSSIAPQSDGVLIPGNQNVNDAEADWRLETFFWPYHHTITNTLAHLWRHGLAPAFVSIHSFTPQLNGGPPRPWHVGILWNRDPRLALPVLEQLRSRPELCVGDNVPYSGRETGYTLETHAGSAGLPHIEFEIRQDLLIDAEGWEHWTQLIAEVLTTVLAAPGIHEVVYY